MLTAGPWQDGDAARARGRARAGEAVGGSPPGARPARLAPVWSDVDDEIIGGDLTAALAYVTPAGGGVVTPVAPIGLRDREAGIVQFTTSLGFGRKLDRIKQNPRVALAYHAREHGFATRAALRARAGRRASYDPHPDAQVLEERVRPASVRFMGEPKTRPLLGSLAERLLRRQGARDRERRARRLVARPRLRGRADGRRQRRAGASSRPRSSRPRRAPARASTSSARRSRRASLPHVLVTYPGADGLPVIVPVRVGAASDAGIELEGPLAAGRAPRGDARPQLPRAADRPREPPAHRLAAGRALRAPYLERLQGARQQDRAAARATASWRAAASRRPAPPVAPRRAMADATRGRDRAPRPRRLLDRAQPPLLRSAARPARLHAACARSTASAARRSATSRSPAASRARSGCARRPPTRTRPRYERYAVAVHHVCFNAASRAVVDERHRWLLRRGRSDRERAARVRLHAGTTRSSSTTPTASSSSCCTGQAASASLP